MQYYTQVCNVRTYILCLNNSITIELSAIINIEYYKYAGFPSIAQKHDYYVKQTKLLKFQIILSSKSFFLTYYSHNYASYSRKVRSYVFSVAILIFKKIMPLLTDNKMLASCT